MSSEWHRGGVNVERVRVTTWDFREWLICRCSISFIRWIHSTGPCSPSSRAPIIRSHGHWSSRWSKPLNLHLSHKHNYRASCRWAQKHPIAVMLLTTRQTNKALFAATESCWNHFWAQAKTIRRESASLLPCWVVKENDMHIQDRLLMLQVVVDLEPPRTGVPAGRPEGQRQQEIGQHQCWTRVFQGKVSSNYSADTPLWSAGPCMCIKLSSTQAREQIGHCRVSQILLFNYIYEPIRNCKKVLASALPFVWRCSLEVWRVSLTVDPADMHNAAKKPTPVAATDISRAAMLPHDYGPDQISNPDSPRARRIPRHPAESQAQHSQSEEHSLPHTLGGESSTIASNFECAKKIERLQPLQCSSNTSPHASNSLTKGNIVITRQKDKKAN